MWTTKAQELHNGTISFGSGFQDEVVRLDLSRVITHRQTTEQGRRPQAKEIYVDSRLRHQCSVRVRNFRRPLELRLLTPALTLLFNQRRQFYLHNRGCGGPSASEPRVIKRLALSHGLSELNLLIGLDGRSSLRPVR